MSVKKKYTTSIDNYKILTKYILSKDNLEFPKELINETPSNIENFKYKLISYFLKQPRINYYLNNYLNDLNTFHKFKIDDWLYTFKMLCNKANINFKLLHITQFKPAKRINIKNELKLFIEENSDKVINENELNELFRLYDFKIISNNNIDEIKILNNRKESKSLSSPIVETILTNKVEESKNINKIILNFNNLLSNYIRNRLSCKNCALYGRPKIPTISNISEETTEIDAVIIAEYPSKDLKIIELLFKKYNLTYLITSLVLCKPTSDKIPNSTVTISNCKEVTHHVHKQFTSYFKILIGKTVLKHSNIKGNIKKINGLVIEKNFILEDPLANLSLYNQGAKKLDEFLEKYSKDKINRINIKNNISQNLGLNFEEYNNYTLFDIKLVEDKLLYILIENETGDKKYIIEDISFPVYIKKGSYQECEFITNNVDFIVHLNVKERRTLLNMLDHRLNSEILFKDNNQCYQ